MYQSKKTHLISQLEKLIIEGEIPEPVETMVPFGTTTIFRFSVMKGYNEVKDKKLIKSLKKINKANINYQYWFDMNSFLRSLNENKLG